MASGKSICIILHTTSAWYVARRNAGGRRRPPAWKDDALRKTMGLPSKPLQHTTLHEEQPTLPRAPLIGNRPALPGVDRHIHRKELQYNTLSVEVRKRRWSSVAHKLEEAEKLRLKSSTKQILASVKPADCDDVTQEIHIHSREQIQLACSYVDQTFGNGDGEVSQGELERAFRAMRREQAERGSREKGRALVRRVCVLIERRGLTLDDFIRIFDKSNDGKLSRLEIRRVVDQLADADHRLIDAHATICPNTIPDYNLPACLATKKHAQDMKRRDRKDVEMLVAREQASRAEASYVNNPASLQNARGVLAFSDSDITDLIRFLDPNADGDITLNEFRSGFERAVGPPTNALLHDVVFGILEVFADEMKKNGLRISDVFRDMDKDGSGTISVAELQATLGRVCGPSARDRALAKLKNNKLGKQQAESRRQLEAARARAKRLKAAQAAGAPDALAHLNEFLRKRDLRLVDLFSRTGFDTSGDSRLDATELQAALTAAGLKLQYKEAVALIEFIDVSGDGAIDVTELRAALRQHRRDFVEREPHTSPRNKSIAHTAKQAPVTNGKRTTTHSNSHSALDPIGLEFDPAWLKSLDKFIARRTGPQPNVVLNKYEGHDQRHYQPREVTLGTTAASCHKCRVGVVSPHWQRHS